MYAVTDLFPHTNGKMKISAKLHTMFNKQSTTEISFLFKPNFKDVGAAPDQAQHAQMGSCLHLFQQFPYHMDIKGGPLELKPSPAMHIGPNLDWSHTY